MCWCGVDGVVMVLDVVTLKKSKWVGPSLEIGGRSQEDVHWGVL